MPADELTAREWWLVREIHRRTLRMVIDGCVVSGSPGRVVAEVLVADAVASDFADLRRAIDRVLEQYKPDAD